MPVSQDWREGVQAGEAPPREGPAHGERHRQALAGAMQIERDGLRTELGGNW